MDGEAGGWGAYSASFVACPSHIIIDPASLAMRDGARGEMEEIYTKIRLNNLTSRMMMMMLLDRQGS